MATWRRGDVATWRAAGTAGSSVDDDETIMNGLALAVEGSGFKQG